MIMQESSCVILILRIFRFIKLRILVLRCPGNTIFGVLEALKFKIFQSSAPAPLGGGGGGLQRPPSNPPGVISFLVKDTSLRRKDTSLRSNSPPPPPTQQRWLRGCPIGLFLMVAMAEGFLQVLEAKALSDALYHQPTIEVLSFYRYVDDSHARF